MAWASRSATCSPKVMVPRQMGVTRRSLAPREMRFMERVRQWERRMCDMDRWHPAYGQRRRGFAARYDGRGAPLLLLQPQHAPLHLAGGGHGQGVDELDLLRVLVGRELAAHVLLQLRHQRVAGRMAGRQHDVGLDQRAALGVGLGHHGGVGHGRVLDQAVLDLARPDAVAGGLEHVVGAALVPEVAVGIARGQVAGAAPVAGELARAWRARCPSSRGRRSGRGRRARRGGAPPRRPARRGGHSLPSSSITATRWPG